MLLIILLIPIYIMLTVLRFVVSMMLRLGAWMFYLIGGLCLLTTILCYYMQLESPEGLRHMLIGSGIFLLIPQAVEILSAVLEVATEIIGCRIKGI